MLNEDAHGQTVLVVLVVHSERLLVQALLDSDPGDLLRIVVLELVNVSNDLALVRSDSGEKKKVLQRSVVREGGGLENDLLEKLDKLGREIVLDESLDGDRDIIGIGALGDSGSDDLVDKLSSVDVIGNEHLGPKIRQTSLDEVSGLVLEHRVGVGDSDELVITETLGKGDEGKVWVPLLAVLSDNKRLVKLSKRTASQQKCLTWEGKQSKLKEY